MAQHRSLKLVFMGSPPFAVPSLVALHEAFEVRAVYTQPPRPSGRGMQPRPTAIADKAHDLGLDYFCPQTLHEGVEHARLARFEADIFVVVAYGLILPKAVLAIPRLGCINGHASLLPRWRGAAPIMRAIAAGDTQTGATLMLMEEGLDTGAMLSTHAIDIDDRMTAQNLHDKLAHIIAEQLLHIMPQYVLGQITPKPQAETGVTYAKKITPQEAKIDFRRDARQLVRHIHSFNPVPGAWAQSCSGRLKILTARHVDEGVDEGEGCDEIGCFLGQSPHGGLYISCGQKSVLEIIDLQPAGKTVMRAQAFLNGQRGAHKWHKGQKVIIA